MASFDIFGPPKKDGIKVGYISTTRGMVDGVSILDANKYAKKDPGTVFIYKTRKATKFLNINEVNELQPTDEAIPDSCEDGLKLESPPEDAKIVFMGGGGVGVRANPVIGRDGAVLAVDLESGGFGYHYPPLAEVRDDSNIGSGAVLRVVAGEQIETEVIYSDEDDYEEYIIPEGDDGGWGDQYTPEGKLLGKWNPAIYGKGSGQFDRTVTQFIQDINNSGKGWWHTRMHPPLKITSDGKTTRTVYNMDNKPYWHEFLNTYGISPKPRSNAKPSSFAGQWFTFEWEQEFPYDGEYKFRAQCDNKAKLYLDNKPISTFQIGFGGAAGHVLSNPATAKEKVKKGTHNIRLELYNNPIMKKVAAQQPPPPSSSEVEFKVTTSSMFGNGVEIEGLNLNIAQENAIGKHVPPINETFVRDVKFGEKYKVIFTSNANNPGGGLPLTFNGLKVPGDKRFVNPKRLEFDDNSGNGFDVNASFTIDKGDVTFSPDGTKLVGKGEVTLTYSWNDLPGTAGKALESIKIRNTLWIQSNSRTGSQTHTINIGPTPVEGAKIKLRKKGDTIVQMEDYVDTSWDDLIISASTGKFTDLKGNIAYFHVPHPPTKKITPKAKSTDTKGEQTRNIFNTIDYIDKANRQLWRTNIYGRGGFINDYGICPFDTKLELKDNPYAGDHKIVWPSVNFPIDGNYDIEVMVDDNVNITLSKGSGQDDIVINKKGFLEGTSISTGKLKVTRFIKQGVYSITADLNQLAGGSFAFKPPSNLPTTAGVDFKVTTSSLFADKITIPGLFSAGKGYGEELSGTQSINKQVEIEKDYDVLLNSEQSNTVRIRIKDDGKRVEMEDLPDQMAGSAGSHFFDDLICTVTEGIFHSPQGDRCKFRVDRSFKGINPMALAINIQTSFTEKEIATRTSFNENPMAVALMIDAPLPPIPQQEIPKEEDSRCPNNPFWSSRFPGGSKSWYPVRFASWGEFHNKYGMSPIPPFDDESTSGGGLKWENTWTKEVPYEGFFKIKMMADDTGEFWVDDKMILNTSMLQNRSYGEKIFRIEKGLRKFKLVVGNNSYETTKMLKTQVFNTLDWITGKSAEIKSKRVTFKITSSSVFANSIRIDELGIFERKDFTPKEHWYNAKRQIDANLEREVEVNKIYEVRLASSRVGANREWDIKYNNLHPANSTIRVAKGNKRIELLDGHGNDTNFALDIDRGNVKFTNDGRRLIVQGKDATITASWKDNPGTAGVAVDSVKIKGKTFRRSGTRGSQTETFSFNDNPDINLRTVGDSILQMEDYTDNSFDDLVCAASEGRFFDLEKDKCKFMIDGGTRVAGGVASGVTRKGATYSGPHLFHYQSKHWGKIINREGVSPIGTPEQNLTEPNPNIVGRKVMTWKGVDFPETGDYQITFLADDIGLLYIGKSSIPKIKASGNFKQDDYTFDTVKLEKGKHDIRVELVNADFSDVFSDINPTGFSLKINANIEVGTGITRSWMQNPVSVSAVLIPPPCPRKIKGKGVVTEVIVDDPGNGFTPPKGGGYPVLLELERIDIKDEGINYSGKDKVVITPGNGAKASLCEGVGPFGKIQKICIEDGGSGFTEWPDISIESETGVNFEGTPVMSTIRDPIVADPDKKLIQVTDLVGIKQTGYYQGRPYYGAVFYQDNVKYAGWYETAGELVQIYDTMQESIDAEVTTPASAILRQGSDVSSNDKRLNLPGTPENLT